MPKLSEAQKEERERMAEEILEMYKGGATGKEIHEAFKGRLGKQAVYKAFKEYRLSEHIDLCKKIMQLYRERPEISKAAISRKTGASMYMVQQAIKYYEQLARLQEELHEKKKKKCPKVAFAPRSRHTACIDSGGRTFR